MEEKDKLIQELTKAKKAYDELIDGLQKKHDEADAVLKQCYTLLSELKKRQAQQ